MQPNSRNIALEKIHGNKVCVVRDLVPHSNNLVIMSHGFRGSSLGPARQFVDFSDLLNLHGISTLRFDQPGSGNSEGDFLVSSFHTWVETTTALAEQALQDGFQIALLGQSMGATTSVIASASPSLRGKIAAVLLWVPDPKTTTKVEADATFEEGGQRYKGRFWNEARESDFFECLATFEGKLHLVYGENDRYISPHLRYQVIEAIKRKQGDVLILPGEDHSPWEYATAQRVMHTELKLLQVAFA